MIDAKSIPDFINWDKKNDNSCVHHLNYLPEGGDLNIRTSIFLSVLRTAQQEARRRQDALISTEKPENLDTIDSYLAYLGQDPDHLIIAGGRLVTIRDALPSIRKAYDEVKISMLAVLGVLSIRDGVQNLDGLISILLERSELTYRATL